MSTIAIQDDVWLPSTCEICSNRCGILAHRVNGVIVKIVGDPDCPVNDGRACSKGMSTLMAMYSPYRVKHPLKRTNPEKAIGVDPRWQQITWEEALDILETKLRWIRNEDPKKVVMATLDGAVMQVGGPWAHAYGCTERTHSFFNPGMGKHVSSYLITGTFQQEVDLDHCRYLILWGTQYGFGIQKGASLNALKMADARARGMKLVVIDPVLNHAAAKADEWIPIRPATDPALALAMVNLLLNEMGIYDDEFLKKQSNGAYLIGPDELYVRDPDTNKPLAWDLKEGKARPYDEAEKPALEGEFRVRDILCQPAFHKVKEHVKKYTLDYVSQVTTVPVETIKRLAKDYGAAASIGSTIVIDGKRLPLRPAASLAFGGIYSKAHAALAGLSIQLLNVIIGNTYVPGGTRGFNLVGPEWRWGPKVEPDGMLAPPEIVSQGMDPYHTKIEAPLTPGFRQLFPLGNGAPTMFFMNMVNKEMYEQVPCKPEILICCRSNFMQSSSNAEQLVEVMRKFSFIVCFAQELDETAEFADLVLPDSHQLERFALFPNAWTSSIPSSSDFIWRVQLPVVDPPGEARCWREVLLEMAYRLGFNDKLNLQINKDLELKEPFLLDSKIRYSYEEIAERYAHSLLGPDKGLDWIKGQINVRIKKKVDELYPLLFMKARIPLYHEVARRHSKRILAVTREMGLNWDISDYQPIPDWKPGPAFKQQSSDYDLVTVFYKLPFNAHSITPNNPWIQELTEHHPSAYKVRLHPEAASRKGIKDGDLIWVESEIGRVKGEAKLTEGIHPEAIAIGGGFGSWSQGKPVARGKGIHYGTLLPLSLKRFDYVSGAVDSCIRVKVYKAH